MFIESCLNEYQSRKDLCEILQCDYRTVRRIINRFKAMVMTNEISKYELIIIDYDRQDEPNVNNKELIMIKEKQ